MPDAQMSVPPPRPAGRFCAPRSPLARWSVVREPAAIACASVPSSSPPSVCPAARRGASRPVARRAPVVSRSLSTAVRYFICTDSCVAFPHVRCCCRLVLRRSSCRAVFICLVRPAAPPPASRLVSLLLRPPVADPAPCGVHTLLRVRLSPSLPRRAAPQVVPFGAEAAHLSIVSRACRRRRRRHFAARLGRRPPVRFAL